MAGKAAEGNHVSDRPDADVRPGAGDQWLDGALFPFEISEPLVALGALVDLGVGLPYIIARATGVGEGQVVAITYEYGNTFVIVAGLLNMLVVLDVFDIAKGRK